MAIEQETAGGTGTEISTLKMVIGGETVDAADGQTFEVVNPATGETIATAPLGGKADVDRAVEAAQKAFEDPKGWANWPAGKRGRSLAKLGELVKKNSRGACAAREPQHRQADHERAGRDRRRLARLRLLRGRRQQDLRPDDPGREARPRHHAQGADRRRAG